MTSRRVFLRRSGAAALALTSTACAPRGKPQASAPGRMMGPSAELGHRLRTGGIPAPNSTRQARVVIAGGGIAGLATAYGLRRLGVEDVLLLDLLDAPGGNASAGRNTVSAYPWGAHYVPLARADCAPMLELFRTLGIIVDADAQGLPIYDEYCLSADPQERLWRHGRWQAGLVPHLGASEEDHAQYQRFFALTEKLKHAVGDDGRPLFSIPLDASSSDAQWRALDRISMHDYLQRQGYTSRLLYWYVNYCCRDDYGGTVRQISAWAGLHYFAARNGCAANASDDSVVTWPEGNGYLVKELARLSAAGFHGQALVTRIASNAQGGVELDYFDARIDSSVRVQAAAAAVCLPRFVAARVVDGLQSTSADAFSYAPWMVANLTLGALPGGRGEPLAWDNVIFDSELLGYVNATHQGLEQHRRDTVLSYYWPLTQAEPRAAREAAQARSLTDWQGAVLGDLLRVHPELNGKVENIDVCLWGHGMIRPTPGFIWSAARAQASQARPPLFFAHSDLSGISIFEEAYCRGIDTATAIATHLRADVTHIGSAAQAMPRT